MKKAAPKKKKGVSDTISIQLRAIDVKLGRIEGTMVTRKEFDVKFDALANAMVTQKEFSVFKHETYELFERIEHSIERLTIAVDKLTKSVEALMLEYGVIRMQLERHDRWFKEIAKKVGVELKP